MVKKSNDTDIKAGIPQGSKLGPLLFIIYINDITEIGLKSDIFIFDDDCFLLDSGKTPENTIAIPKKVLDKISKWASKWKITFIASKTKDILFSKKVLEGVQPLQFNNQTIPRVSSLRHLGL